MADGFEDAPAVLRRAERVTRSQVLSFRRASGCLDERLPANASSLTKAAWAGLQDSVPRAALLSLHARLERGGLRDWMPEATVQLWGPRYNVYVVAAGDHAVFSLGRLPTDTKGLRRAEGTAERIREALGDREAPFGRLGHELGVPPNSLRYAAPTGSVLLRWDGARQPVIWSVTPPAMGAPQARLELGRRYLHVFGPGSAAGFARWGGVSAAAANEVFGGLAAELMPVRTPLGERWILKEDEQALRATPRETEAVRLLPSGDAYFLAWADERSLLVPEAGHREALWTSRVWPGAVLVNGEIAGTWRRAESLLSISAWRAMTAAERQAIEAEAHSLPLPGPDKGDSRPVDVTLRAEVCGG